MTEGSSTTGRGQKIAVIGGGVAGIVSAYLLQQRHDITLFEQSDYLGGHTHTITITDGPDAGLEVDTGFIVLNDATYPLFQMFLARLGVKSRVSEMSFGFQCRQTGLVYAGTDLNGLFAQRRNLVSPTFLAFSAGNCPIQQTGPGRSCQGQHPASHSWPVPERQDVSHRSWSIIISCRWPLQSGRHQPCRSQTFPPSRFCSFSATTGCSLFATGRIGEPWLVAVMLTSRRLRTTSKAGCSLQTPVRQVLRDGKRGDAHSWRVAKHCPSDQVVIATHADQALRLLQDPSAWNNGCSRSLAISEKPYGSAHRFLAFARTKTGLGGLEFYP